VQGINYLHQVFIFTAALTILAALVGWNGNAECICSQVRYLAEEIYRSFRLSILQLPKGRARTAHVLYPTFHTLSVPCDLFLTYFQEKMVPSFLKTTLAQIPGVSMGKHTDTGLAGRVNGKGTDSTAALVEIRASLSRRGRSVESLGKLPPFAHPLGVLQVKRHDFLWCKPHV